MAVTPLPAAPSRATDTAAAFASKADAMMAALAQFVTDVNNTETNINTRDTNTATNAGNAATSATNAAASATAAANSANTAINSPGTSATTTSSVTPAAGAISFTLAQTGKAFSLGQTVICASAAAAATKYVQGAITAFNAGTGAMTINVASGAFAGAAFTDGVVSLAPSNGVTSIAGLSGVITAAAMKSALAIATTDLVDYATDQAARAATAQGQAIAFAVAFGS